MYAENTNLDCELSLNPISGFCFWQYDLYHQHALHHVSVHYPINITVYLSIHVTIFVSVFIPVYLCYLSLPLKKVHGPKRTVTLVLNLL